MDPEHSLSQERPTLARSLSETAEYERFHIWSILSYALSYMLYFFLPLISRSETMQQHPTDNRCGRTGSLLDCCQAVKLRPKYYNQRTTASTKLITMSLRTALNCHDSKAKYMHESDLALFRYIR